jgi:hypothetical protein
MAIAVGRGARRACCPQGQGGRQRYERVAVAAAPVRPAPAGGRSRAAGPGRRPVAPSSARPRPADAASVECGLRGRSAGRPTPHPHPAPRSPRAPQRRRHPVCHRVERRLLAGCYVRAREVPKVNVCRAAPPLSKAGRLRIGASHPRRLPAARAVHDVEQRLGVTRTPLPSG